MKREKPEKGSLTGTLLRLFKLGIGFQESVSLQERDAHVSVLRDIYYNYQEEMKNALEAECKKAKAQLEAQRQRTRMF